MATDSSPYRPPLVARALHPTAQSRCRKPLAMAAGCADGGVRVWYSMVDEFHVGGCMTPPRPRVFWGIIMTCSTITRPAPPLVPGPGPGLVRLTFRRRRRRRRKRSRRGPQGMERGGEAALDDALDGLGKREDDAGGQYARVCSHGGRLPHLCWTYISLMSGELAQLALPILAADNRGKLRASGPAYRRYNHACKLSHPCTRWPKVAFLLTAGRGRTLYSFRPALGTSTEASMPVWASTKTLGLLLRACTESMGLKHPSDHTIFPRGRATHRQPFHPRGRCTCSHTMMDGERVDRTASMSDNCRGTRLCFPCPGSSERERGRACLSICCRLRPSHLPLPSIDSARTSDEPWLWIIPLPAISN